MSGANCTKITTSVIKHGNSKLCVHLLLPKQKCTDGSRDACTVGRGPGRHPRNPIRLYALFHCRGSVAKVVAGSAKELQTFTSVTNQPDRLDVASNFQGL